MTTVEISSALSQAKFLEKAFDLPLISDTYSFGKLFLQFVSIVLDSWEIISLPLPPSLVDLGHMMHIKANRKT